MDGKLLSISRSAHSLPNFLKRTATSLRFPPDQFLFREWNLDRALKHCSIFDLGQKSAENPAIGTAKLDGLI